MTRRCQIVDRPDSRSTLDPAKLATLLAKEGQLLRPLLDLIEHAEAAVDDLIDVMGRATIEAVLLMSAAAVAGPKQQGKKAGRDIAYHGSQTGRVALKERQLRVTKPRLRRKAPRPGEAGEVEIPAYEAMRKDGQLADRMLEILIDGVSTRRYEGVLPEMAATVGVSKSQVSRETIEAGARLLKAMAERDLKGLELLAIWIDGLQLGGHHVICAVGVDAKGYKHVLGLREGATENAAVATALLEDLVRRGLDPARPRLFVIDGSKALRSASGAVFGADQSVQRCRNHKPRNVTSHLPKGQHEQALATMRSAFKLEAAEGMAKLEQYASWLGAGVARGGGLAPRGPGGAVHVESARADELAAPLPGHDEPDRQWALGGAGPDAPGEALAERRDGPALDGVVVRGGLERLPADHGLQGPLDAQGHPGRARSRQAACPSGGCRIGSDRAPEPPPLPTTGGSSSWWPVP